LAQLNSFAEKAFRRPLSESDSQTIHELYEKRIADDASPRQAALDVVKLVLCSPSFLYLSEITEESSTALGSYDLASRLAYALWASPPDDALLEAAKSGTLVRDEQLRLQVHRMLEDERISGFVNGFLDSWLNLRDLGSMPPPRDAYRQYYSEDLPTSMMAEVDHFFRDLLAHDGSVAEFLDANYSFVDKKLAKLYELPEQQTLRLADGFQKVELGDKSHRGGLLGMAAVLAVSANGVETSPVTRGVWVSENILGIQPPSPPDEVPAIDPDVSGATNIRERLAKHRADAACVECHRKIDPYGFSLESFDPVGRWRTKYPVPENSKVSAITIDCSGEFPSGETYEDFTDFKKIIRSTRQDLFVRHLIRQVLAYATGRLMEPSDDFVIDELHRKLQEDGLGLQTLLTECIMSETFRSR